MLGVLFEVVDEHDKDLGHSVRVLRIVRLLELHDVFADYFCCFHHRASRHFVQTQFVLQRGVSCNPSQVSFRKHAGDIAFGELGGWHVIVLCLSLREVELHDLFWQCANDANTDLGIVFFLSQVVNYRAKGENFGSLLGSIAAEAEQVTVAELGNPAHVDRSEAHYSVLLLLRHPRKHLPHSADWA